MHSAIARRCPRGGDAVFEADAGRRPRSVHVTVTLLSRPLQQSSGVRSIRLGRVALEPCAASSVNLTSTPRRSLTPATASRRTASMRASRVFPLRKPRRRESKASAATSTGAIDRKRRRSRRGELVLEPSLEHCRSQASRLSLYRPRRHYRIGGSRNAPSVGPAIGGPPSCSVRVPSDNLYSWRLFALAPKSPANEPAR